jgi:hypothetical protein
VAAVASLTHCSGTTCCPSTTPSSANNSPKRAKSIGRALNPLSIFSKPLYLFEFEGDCGVSFKFDHLRKLTPKFEAVVNAFPIKEDTRTDPVSPPVPVLVGEVIATEVGFLNNVSVDFGVYDMRQKNEASKDPAWASAHSQFPVDSYGICWFDSLPQSDSLVVKSLPSRDGTNNGQTSDYCK